MKSTIPFKTGQVEGLDELMDEAVRKVGNHIIQGTIEFDNSPKIPDGVYPEDAVNLSQLSEMANEAVTLDKMADLAANSLIGRGSGTGVPQRLTLGDKLRITGTEINAEDTTYLAGTLALLNDGTDTVGRVWDAETLADYVKEFDLGFPGTDKDMLFGDGTMRRWIGDVNDDNSIALGKQSTATGGYSAAFRGTATGNFSYAFGGGATGIHSISIGNASGARNPYGIAIGSNAEVEVNNHPTYDGGIAIGGRARSRGTNSIALGRGAIALPHNYMKIGGDTPSDRINHIKFTGNILEFGRDDAASHFLMHSADGKKWIVGITTNGNLSIVPSPVI